MKQVKDPMTAFIERSIDPVTIIGAYFPDWMDIAQNVMCPFHRDTKPSLHIDPSGKAYCHGCQTKARDIVELVSLLDECSYEEAKASLYKDITKPIPDTEIDAYTLNLNKRRRTLTHLLEDRGLSAKVLISHRLGYEPKSERIVVPVFDQFGYCVNLRRLGWLDSHRVKALNVKGRGEVRLYPEKSLVLNRKIVLVEGELDCLRGRSFYPYLPTVTWTGGAGNWNDNYTHMFRDKAVWILYDRDKAGRDGAALCAEKLDGVACHVVVVEMDKSVKGKDLTDWSISKVGLTALSNLAAEVKQFQPPRILRGKRYCPCCGQEVKK